MRNGVILSALGCPFTLVIALRGSSGLGNLAWRWQHAKFRNHHAEAMGHISPCRDRGKDSSTRSIACLHQAARAICLAESAGLLATGVGARQRPTAVSTHTAGPRHPGANHGLPCGTPQWNSVRCPPHPGHCSSAVVRRAGLAHSQLTVRDGVSMGRGRAASRCFFA